MPAVEWQSTFGGNHSDAAYSVAPVDDGGYLVAGATNSYGNGSWDAYLTRFNATGGKMWEKTYGGAGGEWCYVIKPLSDGNYAMVGATSSDSKGGFDVYVVKVDPDGNVLWTQTYGGPQNDAGFWIAEAGEGNLIITGYYGTAVGYSRTLLLKIDRNGTSVWDRNFGSSTINWGKSVVRTADGGYAIAGWRNPGSNGKADLFVTRTNSNGTLLWEHDYGGAGDDFGYGITELSDGGLLAAGHTTSYGMGMNDLFLIRTDAAGNELWNKTYGDTGDESGGAIYALDNGLEFIGSTRPRGNFSKFLLIHADKEGNQQWAKTYGPEDVNVSGSGARFEDGSYVLIGNTNEYASGSDDAFVMKLAGNSIPAVAQGNVAEKATMVVAAVAVGTGLGLLGIFIGRMIDYIVALTSKVWLWVYDILAKLLPIDTVFDFFYGLAKTYSKSIIFRKLAKIEDDHARSTLPLIGGFSSREIWIIVVSSVLLGLAYIVSKKLNMLSLDNLLLYCIMAGFIIIIHDLAHRYFAHKYRSVVEYKFWGLGTIIMFATALVFGLVYAVPARTIINDASKMSPKEQAIVYLAGPAMSALFAIGFLFMLPVGGFLTTIGLLGISMNLLSAVYSLMPVDPMDGKRVYNWKKLLWAGAFIPLVIIYIVSAIFIL